MNHCFLYDVEAELEDIQFFAEECPGVYFLSCQQEKSFCREFYVVAEEALMIPSSVKRKVLSPDVCTDFCTLLD